MHRNHVLRCLAVFLHVSVLAACAPAEPAVAALEDSTPASAPADAAPADPLGAVDRLPPGWHEIACRRDNATRRRVPRTGGEVQRGIDLVQFRVLPNSIGDPSLAAVDFVINESNSAVDVRVQTVPANVSFDPPLRVTMSYARCQTFVLPRGHRFGILRFRQGNWTELPILEHDTLQRTLLTESAHVSRFAVATRLGE